jgi:hypothetical protein
VSEQNHEKVGRSHETDFGDPRVTEAWLVEVDPDLDESDRQALVQEISRQFRLSPAGVPASGLESEPRSSAPDPAIGGSLASAKSVAGGPPCGLRHLIQVSSPARTRGVQLL